MTVQHNDSILVMLVEHDDNYIKQIQCSLEKIRGKYRLKVVSSINDARVSVDRQTPHVVLSDYQLPDGSGMELLHLVSGRCPVVLMTSCGNEEIAVAALKAGAQDYIVKSADTLPDLPRIVDLALREWNVKQKDKWLYETVSRGKREWEQTFDAVPDLISIIDNDHVIKRVNKAMADRCGLKSEEMIGKKCCEVVHGLCSAPGICPALPMMHDGQVHSLEIEEQRLKGFFDITVSPLFDEEKLITSYVHVMRDVTNHKKNDAMVLLRLKLRDMAPTSSVNDLIQATLDACQLLSESSTGFFFLIDETQQNIILQAWSSNVLKSSFTVDGDNSHYPISKAGIWVESFYTRESVIRNDCINLSDPKESTTGHAPVLRQMTVPVVVNDKVVSIVGVGNKVLPYTEHDVYVVKQFVTFAYEVIGRRSAILDLEKSEKKHRKLANEQRIILNTSSVGICFLKNRKVLWSNPAFNRIFGYEAEATYNMDIAILYADNETYEHVGVNGYKAIESGQIYTQEVLMKRKDGSQIWCDIVGQAVTPGNSDDGSIWIVQDITGRKKAEEERLQMEQKYQQTQRLESLGVLAGGIAHDFNNILSIILGHCHIINNSVESGLDPSAHIAQIEKAAGRAADLCRQMLTYAGKKPVVKTNINMWSLVEDNIKMLNSATQKNVRIETGCKHNFPEITGDSAQIQQVVMNLLINAAEAIGDKKGTVQVELRKIAISSDQDERDFWGDKIQAGNYACLEVSDDGCGMDAETQKRVFEPFFTTKFTGRGLGMSAVIGIIKAHEGYLQLTSTVGEGTNFKVFFPLSDFRGNFPNIEAKPLVPIIKGSGTILFVDDEESLRIIGSALLNAMGYSVFTANDGHEAIKIFEEMKSRIDLVLMDLLMPEMSGIDAYFELRKISPVLPIVISSGCAVDGISEKIEKDDKVALIQKPYNPDQLRNVFVKLLG